MEELRKIEQMLICEELKEAELKMDVSICGPEHGEILGHEISEEDLMNYWDSSEASEEVMARETDEAMKPCNFSHSLCMFARCAKDGEQCNGTVTKENEILEVKSVREFLSEKECVDWLPHEEIIDESLFGVRQQVEAVMEQEKNGNVEGKFQGGKQCICLMKLLTKFCSVMKQKT